jgi:hypothetical protein
MALLVAPLFGRGALAEVLPVPCDDADITVQADTREEALSVCRTVQAALPMLEQCHMPVRQSVRITVVGELPNAASTCLGYFQGDERAIYIRPAQAMAASIDPDSAFRGIDADLFFESILVHELGHALFQQNATAGAVCSANHEYVAHAMQMAWLPDEARAQIVSGYVVAPPVDAMRLNRLVLAMAPDRYTALVWQHFAQPEHRCDFVRRLLVGEETLMIPMFAE